MNDVIVAEATPRGRGGISIVRFSGSRVLDLVLPLVRIRSGGTIRPRSARLVDVVVNDVVVDEALLLWFPGPHSFTGEDVIELHVHGNPSLVSLVLQGAFQSGFREAAAGEFTQRAFANGRIDLTQVDALAGLLQAEQAELMAVSVRQLSGSLSRSLHELRDRVLSAISALELGLDFAEEGYEFVDSVELASMVGEISDLVAELRRSYRSMVEKSRLPVVSLFGEPNAGKSTLFNAILGYERSITHAEPGTTRDYVSETVELDGCRFRLVDTAGVRDTSDGVEAVGVIRAREVLRDADLVLSVVSGTREDALEMVVRQGEAVEEGRLLSLVSHRDVGGSKGGGEFARGQSVIFYSAFSRTDIRSICRRVVSRLADGAPESGTPAYLVSRRQDEILASMEEILSGPSFRSLATGEYLAHDSVLFSADLRRLLPLFSELVGEATNEDVLDRVFSRFCIGK